jgi:putative transposase
MKYSASDKTEIIRLVEQSPSLARRTLEKLGIPRSSFYRWYDRYRRSGPEALADRPSRPDRVWNRVPEAIRSQIVDLALDQPELSPRELAVRFTDEAKYFVSEASVYRLLKAHDLIASPAYIVIKASEEFRDKTTAPNQLWQTDCMWRSSFMSFSRTRSNTERCRPPEELLGSVGRWRMQCFVCAGRNAAFPSRMLRLDAALAER